MIRVLVAEDSRTLLEMLVSIFESDPEIEVVGTAADGHEAVDKALRLRPDLVTMDIHMPGLDGLEATKEIMARAPTAILIVTASGERGSEQQSFAALRAGALGLVPKPLGPHHPDFAGERDRLLEMVKALADVKVVRRRRGVPPPGPAGADSRQGAGVKGVVIAASTGGPPALRDVLDCLPIDFPVPVFVVQHISSGFTQGLCQWLAGQCDLRVRIATDGELYLPRTVYLSPDDRHMEIAGGGKLSLSDAPPERGHRPSATRLFRSAAQALGAGTVAVVLTGMGRDGADGLADVQRAGGRVIAQDKQTSVVHGMPGAAVETGRVDEILALPEIGPRLVQLVRPTGSESG